ncbi:MAG: 4'-phosphopantetheinyl transferase family protein [cyanobacterium endosymbiont of Rhopalodia musculus]|uniref:4'-phosphopantetheinyl transferase family protein n=1 Tax=cyanobacterium endosymbiont of Epithemia clementina EcSB TaxID=3034674 RepID=UPI0024813CEC|nr:4'-phosphopantetheinyl transferase superfamily protein [cyanobacterium endosymbiont of Epithemia clementina EcSB]WGT68040.1 4'-phosphopantetheinyl transferase superfamily protein [cyanobacterium endosymbiont of Epithemia clementina EcSB]
MWLKSPNCLTINPSDIHLWKQHLKVSDLEVNRCFEILNQEEKIKAQKFSFEKHKRRFIVARGTLKTILGRYLNIPAPTIEFTYSSRGKPRLTNKLGGNRLQFNLSHSNELAIYGVTCNRVIGVDLEYIRPMSEAKKLAKRFFCFQEYNHINLLTSPDLEKTFFKLWTAKEAYLKATGEGIGGGLDQVEVSLDSCPQLLKLPKNQSLLNWTTSFLIPHPNYQGAIVFQTNEWKLSYWTV